MRHWEYKCACLRVCTDVGHWKVQTFYVGHVWRWEGSVTGSEKWRTSGGWKLTSGYNCVRELERSLNSCWGNVWACNLIYTDRLWLVTANYLMMKQTLRYICCDESYCHNWVQIKTVPSRRKLLLDLVHFWTLISIWTIMTWFFMNWTVGKHFN